MRLFDHEIQRVSTRYGRLYIVRDDSVIGRSLQLYGEWAENEIACYSDLLTDGDIIIDVGANIGTHSIALASRFPHSQIIAFEPQPLAFGLLSANVIAARAGNVDPRNLGCAEREKIVRLAPDYESINWNIGAFSLRDVAEGQTDTPPMLLIALDELSFKKPVQFIKIDVEGMEEAVIAGGIRLISRDRPLIYFEVLEIARLMQLRNLLESMSYELRWLTSDAFNPQNFRANTQNVWRRGETGILALPNKNDPRVSHLVTVTGDETDIPAIEYPEAS